MTGLTLDENRTETQLVDAYNEQGLSSPKIVEWVDDLIQSTVEKLGITTVTRLEERKNALVDDVTWVLHVRAVDENGDQFSDEAIYEIRYSVEHERWALAYLDTAGNHTWEVNYHDYPADIFKELVRYLAEDKVDRHFQREFSEAVFARQMPPHFWSMSAQQITDCQRDKVPVPMPAVVEFRENDFQVLKPAWIGQKQDENRKNRESPLLHLDEAMNSHAVLCHVTGKKIRLSELTYWSVEAQIAFYDARTAWKWHDKNLGVIHGI